MHFFGFLFSKLEFFKPPPHRWTEAGSTKSPRQIWQTSSPAIPPKLRLWNRSLVTSAVRFHSLEHYPNMPEYIWHAKRLIISIHIADIALTWLWIICVRSLCCNLYVIDDYMENEWKWYTLMYGYRHPAYYTYICIVQTVHGSISTCMCCIPMHRPGPSRCSCHAMQLGCSHHTLALLHHGPLKHPQTPRHMGLPEKHQQKKGAESQESSRNTTWTDKTMGLLWFTVSSLLCVLSEDQNIHMAITNDIWQQPVWTLW